MASVPVEGVPGAQLQAMSSRAPELRVMLGPLEVPPPPPEAPRRAGAEDDRQLFENLRQVLLASVPVDQSLLYVVEPTGVRRFGTEAFPPQPWPVAASRLRESLERAEAFREPHLSPMLPGEAIALGDGMRSAWYLPLVARGTLIGIVAAYAALPSAYDGADANGLAPLLGIVASLVAERQFRDCERRTRQAQTELAATEKLSALGQFAEGMAHEVNNPAAYVLANLEHVRRLIEQRTGAPEAVLRAVDEGVEGMRRIRDVLGELSLLSRGTEEVVEEVDVNRIVRAVVGMTSYQVSPRARVEFDLGSVATIASNKARLTQVLLDLILNASQACPADRPDLNVIRVRTRASEGRVDVSVSDTGSGILPEHLPHIFEPFFTTKPAGQGSGLGLAVTRALVRALGGSLRFDTRQGVGTTFTVELPDAPPPAGDDRVSLPTPVAAPSRPRVLLVDDEAGIRRALQRALKRKNEVTAVGSGEEAIELLRNGMAVELVISDLLLPGANGIDIHTFIQRERPELLRRTLFLTGGATTRVARRFVAEHPDSVLVKPVESSRLDAIIQSVAQGASVRRAIEQTGAGA